MRRFSVHVAQAHHGHEILQYTAEFDSRSGSQDGGGKWRDEIADFRAQKEAVREPVSQSAANADHRFNGLRLGEVAELAQWLISFFGARATEKPHASA